MIKKQNVISAHRFPVMGVMAGLIGLFSALLFLSFLAGCNSHSVMYIEDNAYQNMVITIGEHVKEDWKLVDRIKEVFGNGSEFLYGVTRYEKIF